MRPIALSFQAFGPYVERQEIDFGKLAKAGLFLISGETGSGKTTILDAMTYALYGKSSGALRGDIGTMRCQQAPEGVATEIVFDFAIGSRRYRFLRRIEIRKSGPKASHAAGQLDDDGLFVPFGEKLTLKGIEAKAEELLGLKYDQFRQVIVLPQGQFERLLVSESKEKEEILVTLFAADKWQRIAESIFDKVYERKKRLDEEQIRIGASLAAHGCDSLEQLEERIASTAQSLGEKRLEKAALDRKEREARAHVDGEKLVAERFLQLDRQLALRAELLQKRDRMDDLKERLLKSGQAEAVTPLFTSFRSARERLEERRRARDLALREREEAEKFLEQVKIRLDEAEAGAEEDQKDRLRLASYKGMEQSYRELDESGRELKAAAKALKDAEKALADRQGKVLKAASRREDCLRKEQSLSGDYSRMLENYLGNISGTLASRLEPGRACPVCGSLEHPAPAVLLASDVTGEQLDSGQKQLEQARAESRRAEEELNHAAEEERKAREAADQARLEEARRKSGYDHLLVSLDPGIGDLEALLMASRQLEGKMAAYEQRLQSVRSEQEKAAQAFAGALKGEELAKGELEAAEKESGRLQSELDAELAAQGFKDLGAFQECLMDSRQKDSEEQALKAFEVESESVGRILADLEGELQERVRPDIAALESALEVLAAEVRMLGDALAVEEGLLETLSGSHSVLAGQLVEFRDQSGRLEGDLLFARLLRGDRGLSLQRYVLGVMLTSITSEANKLLAEVHDGRYRLRRKPELAGNKKAGLEFEVHDGHSGQYRGVASLSGGEKFLVALSLSIGLSSVVQAQSGGIRLDAMFVDEGFGSLDPGSIREAIGILSHIRGMNNGLVGIISHVDSLKESISAKIEVSKSRSGNSLRISY